MVHTTTFTSQVFHTNSSYCFVLPPSKTFIIMSGSAPQIQRQEWRDRITTAASRIIGIKLRPEKDAYWIMKAAAEAIEALEAAGMMDLAVKKAVGEEVWQQHVAEAARKIFAPAEKFFAEAPVNDVAFQNSIVKKAATEMHHLKRKGMWPPPDRPTSPQPPPNSPPPSSHQSTIIETPFQRPRRQVTSSPASIDLPFSQDAQTRHSPTPPPQRPFLAQTASQQKIAQESGLGLTAPPPPPPPPPRPIAPAPSEIVFSVESSPTPQNAPPQLSPPLPRKRRAPSDFGDERSQPRQSSREDGREDRCEPPASKKLGKNEQYRRRLEAVADLPEDDPDRLREENRLRPTLETRAAKNKRNKKAAKARRKDERRKHGEDAELE